MHTFLPVCGGLVVEYDTSEIAGSILTTVTAKRPNEVANLLRFRPTQPPVVSGSEMNLNVRSYRMRCIALHYGAARRRTSTRDVN